MSSLILATHNQNKVLELRAILNNDQFLLRSLKDIGYDQDIPETGVTLHENASIKAETIFYELGLNVLAEDTGLEVYSLDNEPGVYSARYAGSEANAAKNMSKLLQRLDTKDDRRARFRTVMALIMDGERFFFEGMVEGEIATSPRGSNGFGYDPVFIPEGFDKTFGELDLSVKLSLSHRSRAFQKFAEFMKAGHS